MTHTRPLLFVGAAALVVGTMLMPLAASAAAIVFTPGGAHVDRDPLRDLPVFGGQRLTVDVSFLMLAAPNALTDIAYTLHYDPTELRAIGYEGGQNTFLGQGSLAGPLGTFIIVKQDGSYSPRPFLDHFFFEALPGAKNDGKTDLWLTIESHNNIGAPIANFQMLDVQPIPEPGTLLLMSAGLGVIAWRAKRRRSDAAVQQALAGPEPLPAA